MKKKRTTKQFPKIIGYLELPGLMLPFDAILYFRKTQFNHYLLVLKNYESVILNDIQYKIGVEKFISAVERTLKLNTIHHTNLTFVFQDIQAVTQHPLTKSGIIRFFNDAYVVISEGEYDEILEIISLQNRTPNTNRGKKKADQ